MKFTALRRLPHHTPDLARCLERGLTLGTDITRVGPDRGFLAMQQRVPGLTVVQFRRRGFQAVGHAAVGIDDDVRFHVEIPVVALLGG